MKADTPIRIAIIFAIAFMGFLAHVGIEALMLVFTSRNIPEEQFTEIVEAMSGPAISWIVGAMTTLTALPIALALVIEKRAAWMVLLIISALLTILHTLHYVSEMTEGLNGVGLMSLLVHIVPAIWGCVVMAKWVKHLKSAESNEAA